MFCDENENIMKKCPIIVKPERMPKSWHYHHKKKTTFRNKRNPDSTQPIFQSYRFIFLKRQNASLLDGC
jgi:hypothetical protein